MTLLRISSPDQEGAYQGSKYLKQQVLCDADELQELFSQLGRFWIYPLTGFSSGAQIEPSFFLQEYTSWMEDLKAGRIPTDAALRSVLASVFTADLEALWLQQVPGNRFLVKISQPVVHVQAHSFTYSPIDGVFRPMTMGSGSIFWGLQFSFPQIYQNPKTMELLEVEESPNAEIFQKIRLWVRESTRATPFLVEDKRVNVPIRLGKNCFSWIKSHAQLQAQKIGVWNPIHAN
ncbi:MAG: hypothetical protein V4487_04055 [Chlamydiota bacterium]